MNEQQHFWIYTSRIPSRTVENFNWFLGVPLRNLIFFSSVDCKLSYLVQKLNGFYAFWYHLPILFIVFFWRIFLFQSVYFFSLLNIPECNLNSRELNLYYFSFPLITKDNQVSQSHHNCKCCLPYTIYRALCSFFTTHNVFIHIIHALCFVHREDYHIIFNIKSCVWSLLAPYWIMFNLNFSAWVNASF